MAFLTRMLNGLAGLGAAGLAATAIGNSVIFDVDGGERVVVFDKFRGVLPDVVGEGTHFIIPLVQEANFYSVRMSPYELPVRTPSRDLQNVDITLRVLYRPTIPALPALHLEYGKDYVSRIIPSIGNEILKGIVAQYDAEQLITQREAVSQAIRENLTERAQRFNVELDDVSITELRFGREFTQSVERKQVAQQEAEQARYVVEQAEYDKQANIIRTEGDGEASRLVTEAMEKYGQGYLELKKIKAAHEIAANMARNPKVTYLPGGGKESGGTPVLMNLQL